MINSPPVDDSLEPRVVSKMTWRLIPFLCLCFMVAFIDRVNIGFAKLTMAPDLRLSDTVYATGAGIFFIGYFLFEVPSNLLLERFGARLWIARIMIVWGFVSSSMMLIAGRWSLYGLRFLLGAAEAGFFPGVIYYLTFWFPRRYRARTVSLFMIAAVLSFVVGGPLSGWLLDHPQFGLASWRWLFLVEGIPSVLLGVVVLLYLPNGPRDARWLAPQEAAWLSARLSAERSEQEVHGRLTLGQALTDSRVLMLSLIYFLGVVGAYGLDFFTPTLLAQAYPALSTSALGWVAAIPPLITVPIMILFGRSSDAKHEYRWHVALASFGFALGLVMLSLHLPPVMVVAAMTLCVAGRWAFIGPFWGLPTALLTGTAAAGGIALINSIGNLGGQAGPLLMGWLASPSSSFSNGLLALATLVAAGGVLALVVPVGQARRRSGTPWTGRTRHQGVSG